MIAEAKLTLTAEELTTAEFHTGSFTDLSFLPPAGFDLILSNFGGLNCTSDIPTVGRELARVLKPGGCFLAMVMPRISPWEIVAGLARLQPFAAFRRLGGSAAATGFGAATFRVVYHSAGDFRRALSPWFSMDGLFGVSLVSPPPHAFGFEGRHPQLSRVLVRWEKIVARIPFFRSWGDHYVMVLQKRPEEIIRR